MDDRLAARQGRLHKTTVVSDPLDWDSFGRRLGSSEKLQALEEKGCEVLPTFHPLLFDVYAAMYYPSPQVRPVGRVTQSHRLNAGIMKQLMELPEYREIHEDTQSDNLLSAMAVLEVGNAVIGIITEEQKELIEQMQESESEQDQAQTEADKLQKQAGQAGEQAQQLQSQAQQAQQQGNTGQAKQLQDQASQAQAQTQQLQFQASQAQQTVEQARQKLEELMSQLGDQLTDPGKKAELRQALREAVGDLNEEVKTEKDLLDSFGVEPGVVKQMDYEQIQKLAQQIKSNERLLKIAKKLGAFKRFWRGSLRKREQRGVELVDEIYFGDDIDNMLPSELIDLTHPDLQYLWYLNYAEQALLCQKTEVKEKLGEGPVVILRDMSGSMGGDKEIWAAALELAVTEMVSRTNRVSAHIWYTATSAPLEVVEIYPRKSGKQAKRYQVEWNDGDQRVVTGSEREMSYFEAYVYIGSSGRASGGTDFEAPVRWALKLIEREELEKADIVNTTDGHATLSSETEARVNRKRNEEDLFFLSILINVGSTSEASVKKFSTPLPITALSDEEAGKIFDLL